MASESSKTAASVAVPGHDAARAVERETHAGERGSEEGGRRLELDCNDPRNVRLVTKSAAALCAARLLRGRQRGELAWLSLYEFLRHWRVEPVKRALSVGEGAQRTTAKCTARR